MRLILLTMFLIVTGWAANAQSAKKHSAVVNATEKSGTASFYHDRFEGRPTATGETFDNGDYTAACNKLKLGTYVKVTNLVNGTFVYVRINDRMSPNNKRLIDLASVAADQLGFKDLGLTKVKVEIVPLIEGQMGILAQKEVFSDRKDKL